MKVINPLAAVSFEIIQPEVYASEEVAAMELVLDIGKVEHPGRVVMASAST